MAGNIKINPELAQSVSGTFGNKSADLSSIISALDAEVNNQIGTGKPAWEGNQADAFDQSWTTEFRPALQKLVDALDGARDLLNKTISAYQQLDS